MTLGADFKAGLSGLARLWNAGRVNALGAGLSIDAGGTISSSGGTISPTAPFVVNSNTVTPTALAGTLFEGVGAPGTTARDALWAWGANPVYTGVRANGTAAAPTAVVSGNVLARFDGIGHDGTIYGTTARANMSFRANENWTPTAQGTSYVVAVTLNGGTVTADVVTVDGLRMTSTVPATIPNLNLRTVPFAISGKPGNAQKMIVTMTQAGTLQANGGVASGTIGTNPTATNTLVLSTINAGVVTTQGTISINSGGTITFPTFAAVAVPAGGALQLVNQATADATLADFCLSLQFKIN